MLRRLRARVAAVSAHVDGEDGTTLVLYPFAVLIVLGLGGLALDFALLFQAHRDAVDTAAALASDIAAVVDEGTFATSGETRIDLDRARQLVDLTNGGLVGHPHGLTCAAIVPPAAPTTVEVACSGRAEAILLPAGGIVGSIDLRGIATASAVTR